MNGPQRTACFAKGMHNIPEVRNGSRTGSQNRKLSDKTRTNERTDGECSILRFAPALNEPLRNNDNNADVMDQLLIIWDASIEVF